MYYIPTVLTLKDICLVLVRLLMILMIIRCLVDCRSLICIITPVLIELGIIYFFQLKPNIDLCVADDSFKSLAVIVFLSNRIA